MKKTVVIGATDNPSRFAYKAVQKLLNYGHEVVPVGIRHSAIGTLPIQHLKDNPRIEGVDTVTMYVGPQHQPAWYDYILSLNPKRIIFNPGTENLEFERMAEDQKIETMHACTLVMLASGSY
ncbi:CoA-binding protein [Adhaeribacter sp. BT258]|uniref:CoA-binding protein n=1 Tax=Adhaeribacter terrigena TaxID=2793070 RepID=A0ABS1C0L1_9BACT|nr:CoA-binding protein [Adhaeribacter terrigena]MBK0402940.1 CoA-binding protein [Adhaeribacter terrigena]